MQRQPIAITVRISQAPAERPHITSNGQVALCGALLAAFGSEVIPIRVAAVCPHCLAEWVRRGGSLKPSASG